MKFLRGNDFVHRQQFVAFDTWKIVEVFPDVVAVALVEVDFVVHLENQIIEISCRDFHFLQLHGALHHGLSLKGEALGLQRAKEAVGILGRAVQGAEFHQRLVVEAGLFAVEQYVSEVRKQLLALININRCVDVEQSGEYAKDVAVNDGMGQAEGDGRDGGSSVVANAFQALELLVVGREFAPVFLNDLSGAVMQVAGA